MNWTALGAVILAGWLAVGFMANLIMECDVKWEKNTGDRWLHAFVLVPPAFGLFLATVFGAFMGIAWIFGQVARGVASIIS